jgi:3-deoxy-D-manno-octulosonic-acid transferase
MNFAYAAYTALTSGLFMAAFPPFWAYTRLSGRYRRGLRERLGYVPTHLIRDLPGSPRIWIHAVSLGEVKVALSIKRALRTLLPECAVVLSTTTEHGRDLAMESLPDVPVFYAPVDFVLSVRKALHRVRPHVVVFLETEIWPAWLAEARGMGIRTALVNGRISPRSLGPYLKFRPFFRRVLENLDAFSMISEEDARRIRNMGAETGKIEVHGNAKYDLLAAQADPGMEEVMRRSLNLAPSQNVLVAGSTREGEEAMILDAYESILKEFPDTLLFIAPRHIVRAPDIESLLRRRGFHYHLRSDIKDHGVRRTAPVVIMNTFGELFGLYSVGTICFCGASLVPLGGQNPLEPAVWGKPVLYGPSMEDFLDARALLEESKGGMTVSGPESLAEKALWFLNHPRELEAWGARAKEAVVRNRHAAEEHARVVARLL